MFFFRVPISQPFIFYVYLFWSDNKIRYMKFTIICFVAGRNP